MPAPIPAPLVERLLDTWPVARLATLAEEGQPHLVPIVFAWHGGALWSPIDGKPKASTPLARVRNVERDPRAAVLLDRYTGDWKLLWWIRIDGRAEVMRGSGAAEPVRAKYPQYRDVPLFRSEPIWLRVAPERTASWYASEAVLDELRAS